MITADEVIRTIDDTEWPAPGRWAIEGRQRVALRAVGWRRRTFPATTAGVLAVGVDPAHSSLDLLVTISDDGGIADTELAIVTRLADADPHGQWRFTGHIAGSLPTPVTLHARYHGVYRNPHRATAWLTVRGQLPRLGRARGGRVDLTGDLIADAPLEAA